MLPAKPHMPEAACPQLTVTPSFHHLCSHSQVLAPELEKVADHFEERITFMKMDSDVETEIASRLEVYALPTLLLYKDGQLITRLEGAFPAKMLTEELEKVFFD
uniref:Thioredoxin domain-containing protein n=1 Tax=Phaeomonas parva TaxID=124430 RepID=A0A7S1XYR2_9STRA|mmetsp:Transcript_9643/g.28322  ORF Transcript_9643/g.28322 Transcript_9643/m.28322 type:complete len:104 (+) Transcript_9643:351-662(+)